MSEFLSKFPSLFLVISFRDLREENCSQILSDYILIAIPGASKVNAFLLLSDIRQYTTTGFTIII